MVRKWYNDATILPPNLLQFKRLNEEKKMRVAEFREAFKDEINVTSVLFGAEYCPCCGVNMGEQKWID